MMKMSNQATKGIEIKKNEVVLISGTRDMGKTKLFLHIIKKFLNKGYEVVIYDSEHEFEDLHHEKLLIYKPTKPANKKEFDNVSEKIYERRNVIFAVESVDFYATPKDTELKKVPNFKKIVHWGRKRNIGLIMTTRRVAGVHKDCVGASRHHFMFWMFLPNDIDYLKKYVGETAEELITLERWYYIHWCGERDKDGNPKATIYPPIRLEE